MKYSKEAWKGEKERLNDTEEWRLMESKRKEAGCPIKKTYKQNKCKRRNENVGFKEKGKGKY